MGPILVFFVLTRVFWICTAILLIHVSTLTLFRLICLCKPLSSFWGGCSCWRPEIIACISVFLSLWEAASVGWDERHDL